MSKVGTCQRDWSDEPSHARPATANDGLRRTSHYGSPAAANEGQAWPFNDSTELRTYLPRRITGVRLRQTKQGLRARCHLGISKRFDGLAPLRTRTIARQAGRQAGRQAQARVRLRQTKAAGTFDASLRRHRNDSTTTTTTTDSCSSSSQVTH